MTMYAEMGHMHFEIQPHINSMQGETKLCPSQSLV